MKKNILIIGENSCIEELLILNNYTLFKEENREIIDLVVAFDREIIPEYIVTNEDIPVVIFTKDSMANLENCREDMEFIVERKSNREIIDKIESILSIKELQNEKKRLMEVEKELICKLNILNAINKKLFLKSKEMEEKAEIDSISNVYNKKYMIKRIKEEQAKVERFDRNFAIAVIELKYENQDHNDQILKKCAAVLTENIRSSDIAGVMRENVFLVMFPEIIEKYTINVMQKLIFAIENIIYKDKRIETYSGFLVVNKTVSMDLKRAENIVGVMEKLLYFAKESDQKIVEYCEEKIESVEKVKKYIEESEEDKHSLILDELSKSQKFIEKLLPKQEDWKEKLSYSYLYAPFNFIGGDFFDFSEVDENRVALIFCDVSGHGVSSALYITAIKYIFKNLIQKEKIINPSEFMEKFNRNIAEISEGNIFVTTIFGIVDKKELSFKYGFGGGTNPIKIESKTDGIKILEGNGIAVGLVSEATFETKEEKFEKGDILFFYSDGIYEFLIEKKRIKEQNEFIDIVKSCIDEDEVKFISKIYEVMQEKTENDVDFDDDITLLAVKF